MKDLINGIVGLVVLVIGTIGFLLLLAIVMGFPTMWCWNYVMPVVFKLPTITLDVAIVMNVLAGLLFKNTSSSSKK